MWIVLAVFSAIIFGIASVVMKAGTEKKLSDYHILWGLYLSGSLFFLATLSEALSYNLTLLISSTLIAIGSFLGNYFVIKALGSGPASLTAPMLNLNLPLIIIMSVIFYGESLTLIKVIIIVLLLIAIILVKFDPNEDMSIKDKRWLLWVILGSLFLFLREGGLKITLEMGLNNKLVLLYSYIICLVISTIYLIKDKNNLSVINQKSHYQAIRYGLLAGVCSGGGLFLYSTALNSGPASIVALIFSARSLVIIFLTTILFKEKLSPFQKVSVGLLCLGILLASFI
ncbi:MAG: EamA family transporter [Burkholderiales bacterium]|nr:EamA family transporter [Burkholderiales bacterium]